MNKKIVKRLYNVVVILLLAGAVTWCFSHFVHGSNVEYTDDAQVCRHITPINTRVQGFIKEIRFTTRLSLLRMLNIAYKWLRLRLGCVVLRLALRLFRQQ